MTKRQKRLLIIIGVLVVLLALLAAYYYYYSNTKKLTFTTAPSFASAVAPPQFLFSFSGTGLNRLQRPVGVMVDKGKVYVADSARRTIFTYDENGKMTGSFGASQTLNPLYIAKNPKDGLLYVSDRRLRQVLKFTTDGKYKGVFDPKLPKSELPKFKLPKGVQWAPSTLTFGQRRHAVRDRAAQRAPAADLRTRRHVQAQCGNRRDRSRPRQEPRRRSSSPTG